MKVDSGSIDLRMIDNTQIAQVIGQLLPQLGLDPAKLTSAVVKTELPLPASLTWGVSFRPVPKWEFAVDLQYVLWSAYDKLDVKILEPSSNTPVLNIPVSDKKYSNTLAFRFGGQYHALDWLTARMGMYVDESPVRSDYLNPETPSMTKLAYTAASPSARSMDEYRHRIRLCQFGRSRTYGLLSLHQFGAGHRERKTGGSRRSRKPAHQSGHRFFG